MAAIEAAIDALAVAEVGNIQRDVELNGAAEMLNGQLPGLLGHGFQMIGRPWGQEGQQIHGPQAVLVQAAAHMVIGNGRPEALKIETGIGIHYF